MNTNLPSTAINVETNNTCNLRCPLCPANNGMKRKRGYIQYEMWQRLALELAEMGVQDVELVGFGEPLLHPDLPKIVRFGIDCGIRIHISTNAMLLNRNVQEQLLRAGITSITVCIDGASSSSHEEYRRGSNFLQTLSNIQSLVTTRNQTHTNTQILLQSLITRFNENEIEQLIKLGKQLQVDRHSLKTIALGTYQSELQRQESAINWLPSNIESTRYDYAGGKYQIKQTKECPWWSHLPFVLWNGDVTTCCHDYDGRHAFASLKTKKFSEILQEMMEVREGIRNRALELCRQCQQTHIRNLSVMPSDSVA